MPGGVLLTKQYVASLVKRNDFYDRLPEFRTLKNVPAPKGGCRGCGGRAKNDDNVYNLFRQILSGLKGPAVERLKRYVNADFVQFIGYNKSTRKTETITL